MASISNNPDGRRSIQWADPARPGTRRTLRLGKCARKTADEGGGSLKPSDVAALLNVAVRKVWAWIADGGLPAINVTPRGARPTWRVDAADYRVFRDGLSTVKPATRNRRARLQAGTAVFEFIK